MSNANIQDPADALVDMLAGLDTLKAGYLWERAAFDEVPCGTVGVPTLRRREPDQAESELMSLDYNLTFPVSLYFDLTDALSSQQQMVDALAELALAIDADPSLDTTAFDSAITEAEPFVEKDRARPLCGYQVTVAVLKLAPQ